MDKTRPRFTRRALRIFGHQRWILRGRDRVIRWFFPPDAMADLPFVTDFFGFRYRGNFNNYIDWMVFFYGCYSRNELYLLRDAAVILRKLGRKQVFFFDVGANIGHHSLFMSRYADKVFAFEPYEKVSAKLAEKIADNALINIEIFPVALGSEDKELDYFEPAGPNAGTGTFSTEVPDNWSGTTRRTMAYQGDALFKKIGLPRIDILKIDVEGFEPEALRGLRQRLISDRPVILMELSDTARKHFGDEPDFRACFYRDHVILDVGSKKVTESYDLRHFNYSTCHEALIVPAEMAHLIKLPKA
jgi:FkbM family methyltransferase